MCTQAGAPIWIFKPVDMNTGLLQKAHFICFGYSVAIAALIKGMLYMQVIYERRIRSMPPQPCDPFTHCTRCIHGARRLLSAIPTWFTRRMPFIQEDALMQWKIHIVDEISDLPLTFLPYCHTINFLSFILLLNQFFLRQLLQTCWKPLKKIWWLPGLHTFS